ncbi:hypothetical protein IHE45_03G075400 [Dioscorea alata]|uniref:Uncharacterized protein n=1 Tax=Dioscorea alata TaxID=55571 RepID=A0ACB7WLN8_DIOAL|nr:hypothetical protein IHE45_03G075400 [Dioscorea alata]
MLISLNLFLWINCVNPVITSFLSHPWMFDIPIAFKPVFLNMNFNVEEITIDDLLVNSSWNMNALNQLFGYVWDSPIISHGMITNEDNNHWIWLPESKGNKISFAIYTFLNGNYVMDSEWKG